MTAERANILHVIEPRAVYSPDSVRTALGLTKNTLRREVRLGRLRMAKRAGRNYFLGEWLLEWIKTGEIKRRRADPILACG
jgi:hypothetical protein